MALAALTSFATIFIFSILFYSTISSACNTCKQSPPPPKPKSVPCPPPPKSKPAPPTPKPKSPPLAPKPKSPPTSPPSTIPTCPRDTLKLGACANLLGGVIGSVVGTPASSECCAVLSGLADLEAAVCLCTAIKANVLGINLNVPVTLSLLISACEKEVPPGFKCQ
ncbi:hypothetical protein LguiB_027570 [Lonicera macranthoides]